MSVRVVVFSCQPFGVETANAISALPMVSAVELFSAPLPRRSLRLRLRHAIRSRGRLGAVLHVCLAILRRFRQPQAPQTWSPKPGVTVRLFSELHESACLAALNEGQFDIGIVDGTGILRPEVFDVPRLGSINLHCGKLPDYRGAPPVFWELFNGERTVGVSVHRVASTLDSGEVFATDEIAIELAPLGDPIEYARRVWMEVLRPRGIELICQTVVALENGTANGEPQPPAPSKPNRTPTKQQIDELRHRIAARRTSATSLQ